MCGIMGYIGERPAVPILLDGLRRLEYRGYDSAGVAVMNGGGIEVRKAAGKLARLAELVERHRSTATWGSGTPGGPRTGTRPTRTRTRTSTAAAASW